MAEHSAEPWAVVDNSFLVCGDGLSLVNPVRGPSEQVANRLRIVACINACEGMDDPTKTITALLDALGTAAQAGSTTTQRTK